MSNLYTQTEKTFPEGAVFVTAHKEGYVCFAPMGGGFGYKLPEDQFFAEFRAVTEAEQQTASETYRAAMFEIDDLWPHPLPGFTNGCGVVIKLVTR